MKSGDKSLPLFHPADICRALLTALDAADGRRKRRKRDQTPDAIGLALKRQVLESVIEDNPDGEYFEAWLLEYTEKRATRDSLGAVSAMARSVLEEWRLAQSMDNFKAWLERGAPSEDAGTDDTASVKA